MQNTTQELTCPTHGPGLYEITTEVVAFVHRSEVQTGLLTVFCRHTSASVLIQENADPDVQTDLQAYFKRLVPEGDPLYQHTAEGPDDMPAHVKSALTASSVAIPVTGGKPALGTWQGIYLFEHRRAPHTRKVLLHVLGT